MRSFRVIHQSYLATDGELARQEALATRRTQRERWRRARTINDQAFFVLIFAQLEDHVRVRCGRLIAKRRTLARAASRRIREIVEPDKLPFMKQVALLLDKGSAEYGQIKQYYDVRCDIAHGTIYPASPIFIPRVAAD